MLKTVFIAFVLLYNTGAALAQDGESWDIYLATYEKGTGSVLLNMSLINKAPVKDHPYILVTGVRYTDCDSAGFPTKKEFETLYKISDAVKAILEKQVPHIMAGTFTYQCERLDYYYLKDTAAIRNQLESFYREAYSNYQPYISIKADPKWEAYLQFLYPSEEIREYMENQKVVMGLINAGDKLEKERQVDHWLYFNSEADRQKFIEWAGKNKFKVEEKNFVKDSKLPYQLRISRVDAVKVDMITAVTLLLKKEAQKYKGDYDGWETFVIKE